MNLIRIPRCFADDHDSRDLPGPEYVRSTARHHYIRAGDPGLDDLLSDARFYSDPNGPDHPSAAGARAAARALLKSLNHKRAAKAEQRAKKTQTERKP